MSWIRIRQLTPALLAGLILTACSAEGEPPDPSDPAISAAHDAATTRLDAEAQDLAASMGATVIAAGSDDGCWYGSRNWKRDDPWAAQCRVRQSVIIGFDGDFRERVAAFDAHLARSGWTPQGPRSETLTDLIDEYWEMRANESTDGEVRIHDLPSSTTYEMGPDRPRWSFASRMAASKRPGSIPSSEGSWSLTRPRSSSALTRTTTSSIPRP